MQDVQNIPNPDSDRENENSDFGSHSDVGAADRRGGVETPGREGDVEQQIPYSGDNESQTSNVELDESEDDESDLL